MILTSKILNNICPSLKDKAANIAVVLNQVTPEYGMNYEGILEEFIPNLLVESAEFTTFEENLNYSVGGLIEGFSRNRISINQINKYGRTGDQKANKAAIANCIYGGEWGKINLGNTQIYDGYDFRGSGPIQATGRGIITQFTAFYNRKFSTTYVAQQVAAMMRDKENIEMGIHFACWFFSIAKNLIPFALNNQFKDIIKRINGGYNGVNERTAFYERCKIFLYTN